MVDETGLIEKRLKKVKVFCFIRYRVQIKIVRH